LKHILFLLYIIAIASVAGGLITLIFLYITEKSRTLKYYIFFDFSFSAFLFLAAFMVYVEINNIQFKGFNIAIIMGFLIATLLIYSILLLANTAFNKKINKRIKFIYLLIALIPLLTSLPFLIIYGDKVFTWPQFRFYDFSISFIFLAIFMYILLNPKKFIEKIEPKNIRKIYYTFYVIFGCLLLFTFINDLRKLIQNRLFSETEFFVLPVFFIIWNSFNIYYSIKHYKYKHIKKYHSKISLDFIKKYSITDREKQVISLILKGFKNKEIAAHLALTSGTIKGYIHKIYKKIGVQNRVQLVKIVQYNSK
jgi:DNA-binding CsgD family transcriptional regulator